MKALPQARLSAALFTHRSRRRQKRPWEGELTLVLDELVQEAGLPRPGAADYEELEQEVCERLERGVTVVQGLWEKLVLVLFSRPPPSEKASAAAWNSTPGCDC